MAHLRRSGRISREIPIVLLGTDTSGRVFSEQTQTLVLSLHGAGILSRNKLAPDEVLTLRLPDSNREAEIRLVGSLGEERRGYVYGVTFCDPQLDFWQIEFPEPDLPSPDRGTGLECSICGSRSLVEQSEVEADVFVVSRSVLRYCDSCGQTTLWKLAAGDVAPPSLKPVPNPLPQPPATAPVPDPVITSAGSQPSAYSDSALCDLVSASFVLPQPVEAPVAVALKNAPPKSTPASPPQFSAGGKPNRRRHVRTRVSFTACVRVNHLHEEVVECENVSKGGLCFRSRKQYSDGAAIEVAVPYSPGQPAIFVAAQIRRVEELPAAGMFRYGVAYT